ncbi:hypothetical protein ACIQW9_10330 [Herminiimonas sp. NPDC097707]|uniref:hypothetical protein n=1 Tax=Herminiimonas sp. NPDC097707 TaxID=3364007 RepID=UPI00383AD1E8
MPRKKWETGETRLRLKQRPFLFPFSARHNRQRQQRTLQVRLAFGFAEPKTVMVMNLNKKTD